MVKPLTTAEVARSPPSRTRFLNGGSIAMELTTARLSRPGPPSRLGVDLSSHAAYPDAACRRVPDFVALMKPRVMALAVFTDLVGLLIAPGHVDPVLGAVAVL